MKLIKVSENGESPVYFNPSAVSAVYVAGETTVIELMSGTKLEAPAKPEAVVRWIEKRLNPKNPMVAAP